MKTLITYYSYSGITDKVAGIFADVLKKKGEVVSQRLKPKVEIVTFLGQCKAAFTRQRTELVEKDLIFDASAYDLILIGCPVWAFAPVPAINTYLDKISGLNGKRVIVFLTSGSGAGVGKCFKNIRTELRGNGAYEIDEVNIPNRMMGNENSIISSLEKVL